MKLEEVLRESKIQSCQLPEKLTDNSKLEQIKSQEFYYSPPFTKQREDADGRFLLFSAPGAVGKTALAKRIAHEYGGLYWNVGETNLGDGSFTGVLNKALGRGSEVDKWLDNLARGRRLLILDAFDEASLLCTFDRVCAFLKEIDEALTERGAKVPYVILTARTRTAEDIVKNVFDDGNIPFRQYRIEYFEKDEAENFIKEYCRYKKRALTMPQQQEIKKYLAEIETRLGGAVQDSAAQERIRSFLGYSQALMVLCRQVEEAFASDPKSQLALAPGDGKDLIFHLMQDLIDREQKKLDAFKDSIRPHYQGAETAVVDGLYNKREQLERLQWFVTEHQFDPSGIELSDYSDYTPLKPDDEAAYLNSLRTWLPEHVFLNNEAVSPVFIDYLFAESLLDPNLELLMERYADTLRSRVFMDCYLSLSGGKVRGEHISHLNAAFASSYTKEQETYCNIYEDDIDDPETPDAPSQLFIEFLHRDRNSASENSKPLEIVQDEGERGETVRLDSAENIRVSIRGTVIFEQSLSRKEFVVRNANIECDKLILKAANVVFKAYSGESNQVVVRSGVQKSESCKIVVQDEEKTRVSFPPDAQKQFYEFRNCWFEPEAPDSNGKYSVTQFVYGLRKVLEQCKGDGYGAPGKFKEKIDLSCGKGVKAEALAFLKEYGVVREDKGTGRNHTMYLLDLEKMSKLKIHRAAYLSGDETELKVAYDEYCNWSANSRRSGV